jgi:hypothetical protein
VFQLSAIQAWNKARELQVQAARNRSILSYHRLRIGLKKLRYTVENFLPDLHAEWGSDLRDLQDCLGEQHDLSVLWGTMVRIRAFPDVDSRERWRASIQAERERRIEQYRSQMMGDNSRWGVWRAGLPAPSRLRALSLRMIEKYASFHGINLVPARSVRRLALQLFDCLCARKSSERHEMKAQRAILHAASILHEAGRSQGKRTDGKAVTRLLRQLSPPPGFTSESLQLITMVLCCQRGKFREITDPDFASLSADRRQTVLELAGILRLARVLARDRGCPVRSLKAQCLNNSIVIFAEGYSEFGPLAEKAARARHTLECAFQMPVLIRSLPAPVK